jgi:hypothetical protein
MHFEVVSLKVKVEVREQAIGAIGFLKPIILHVHQ